MPITASRNMNMTAWLKSNLGGEWKYHFMEDAWKDDQSHPRKVRKELDCGCEGDCLCPVSYRLIEPALGTTRVVRIRTRNALGWTS